VSMLGERVGRTRGKMARMDEVGRAEFKAFQEYVRLVAFCSLVCDTHF
jgi:hypothetical protein